MINRFMMSVAGGSVDRRLGFAQLRQGTGTEEQPSAVPAPAKARPSSNAGTRACSKHRPTGRHAS